MRTIVAFKTDVGRVREGNEDSVLIQDPVFAVADGMGGHVAGDVASQTAIETITDGLAPEKALDPADLAELIKAANVAIWEKAQGDTTLRGMGTTCTLVLVDDSRIHIGHVGDSRAYLFRDGRLEQLTEDHTLVGRMVKEGRLQPEEAERHPQRNIITRTLGVDPEVQVDTTSVEISEGDRIIICSDGLTSMLDAETILAALAEETEPQAAVDRLVEEANAAGGEDNVTVVIVEFQPGDGTVGNPGAATAEPQTTPRPVATTPRVDTRPDELPDHFTQAVDVSEVAPSAVIAEPKRRSKVARVVVATILIIAVLAVGGVMIFRYAIVENSYFVGVNGDGKVAIYQGLPDEVAGVTFKEEQEVSAIAITDLPEFLQTDVEEGIEADSLEDAQETVANLEQRARDKEFEKPGDQGGQDKERENT